MRRVPAVAVFALLLGVGVAAFAAAQDRTTTRVPREQWRPIAEIIENEGLPSSIRQIAESEPYPYRGVWTPWRLRWEATGGPHTIRIKAVDAAGNEQPPEDETVSDGLTAVTEYHITVG